MALQNNSMHFTIRTRAACK